MVLPTFQPKSDTINLLRESRLVYFALEVARKFNPETDRAYLTQVGSYVNKLQNVLSVDKLKTFNRAIEFKKKNIRYSIAPDPENPDTVNIIIGRSDPKNPDEPEKVSTFSFVNGRLAVGTDVHGNIRSRDLVAFLRDFNLELQQIDLIVKKEYEFFQVKQRLPGVFCGDWQKPFEKKLHVKKDKLEIKRSKTGIEFSYFNKGEKLTWTLSSDFRLITGDLGKFLFVLNAFANALVGFDTWINNEIRAEKAESNALINNLDLLFTKDPGGQGMRIFSEKLIKTENNTLSFLGDGKSIIIRRKRPGEPEQQWILNADKKIQHGSAGARDLYLSLRAFKPECEKLKKDLQEADETQDKKNPEILSYISQFPHVFMKRNDLELKNKEGAVLRLVSNNAFNTEGAGFYVKYEKPGDTKYFYFANNSLQSQTKEAPPLGSEQATSEPGTANKIYFFNTDPAQLLESLKEFESQFQEKEQPEPRE